MKEVAEIEQLRKENASLLEMLSSKDEEILKLRQQLLYYTRNAYGRRSEKRMPERPEGQLFFPFEGEDSLPEETADIQPVAKEIQVEAHKRRKEAAKKQPKREEIPSDIERRVRVIEPKGIDLSLMTKIGEDVREILQHIPGSFYVDRIVRPVYKEKVSSDSVSTPIYQAEPVDTFLPKSIAGNTLLQQLIISKYVDHLPVYRQLEIFKREGVKLADSTVYKWMHEVAAGLYPLYQKLAETVLSSDYIQMDESTLPVIDKDKHRAVKGYVWSVRDVHTGQVFFHYDKGSRSRRVLISILRDYRGTVQTDGYEAYSIYENKKGVLLLGCWAHARRKFESALSEDKRLADEALDYIRLLYEVEANLKARGAPPDEIAEERKRLSYPVLLHFEKWMKDTYQKVTPKSLLGKAISYTFSIYHRLVRYVSDGRYQIDNNGIENTIRPLAVGRKNYLFAGNHTTAGDTALYYSLLVSCKQVGVDPAEWLLDILNQIKERKTDELDNLLPANWKKNRDRSITL